MLNKNSNEYMRIYRNVTHIEKAIAQKEKEIACAHREISSDKINRLNKKRWANKVEE